MRKTRCPALAIVLLFALPAAPAGGEEEPAQPPAGEVTAEQRDEALVQAFRFLDEALWSMQENGGPRKPYALAVAGWAYLLADARTGRKLPSRKRALDRIRDALERYVDSVARLYERDERRAAKRERQPPRPPTGPPGAPDVGDLMGMRTAQYTWPLAMAGHFFAESAARGKHKSASKKTLRAIVRVLEASQQADGGWGHDDAARPGMGLPPIRIPKPGGGQLTYPATLLAASNCALSALGVAHRALGSKDAPALERARGYFGQAQNGDGSFPYDPSQKHATSFGGSMAGSIEVARTGGAVYALHCAGAPADDPVLAKAVAAIDVDPALLSEGHGSASMALQLGALACRVRGDEAWARFRREFFPRLLAHQEESGAFTCACAHDSPAVTCDTRALPGISIPGYVEQQTVYVTAIHTLILLLDRDAPRAVPPLEPAAAPVTTR